MSKPRNTGAKRYEAERHELDGTGPEGVKPDNGLSRMVSGEYLEWLKAIRAQMSQHDAITAELGPDHKSVAERLAHRNQEGK